MKCIRFVSIIIVVLMMSLTCFGSEKLSYNDEIKVYINNNEINLDMYPFIEDNRTMVPMRGIFEALDADVDWDENNQTVIATKNNITISVTINSDIMIKNKESIKLDVPARLVDDCRTYVPLRAVSEALGCMVRWDDEYSIVDIIDDSNLPDKWHVGDISCDEWFGYYYFNREDMPENEYGYFSDCSKFSDGLAAASQSNKYSSKKYYGYINEYGYFVIPDIYTEAGDFQNGIAIVKSDFYPYPYRINTKGECVDNIELKKKNEANNNLEVFEDKG